MKLQNSSLSAHLSRDLLSVYLVSGDEPLLVQEAVDAIRAAADVQGFTDRESWVAERGFDWDRLRASSQNLSLFGDRKLLEVRLPTGRPGDAGSKALTALADDTAGNTLLLVVTPRLDSAASRTRWVRSLEQAGAHVSVRIPAGRDLVRWLAARLQGEGVDFEPEVPEFLASRVEGNLVAASHEVEKLALLSSGQAVSLDQAQASVTDGSRYDVFQLADAAVDGNPGRAVRVLNGLRGEGVAPALVAWALVRESLRLADLAARQASGESLGPAMKRAGVWRNRQNVFARRLKAINKGDAGRLLRAAADADRVVKGARFGDSWSALLQLTLVLAGQPLTEGPASP